MNKIRLVETQLTFTKSVITHDVSQLFSLLGAMALLIIEIFVPPLDSGDPVARRVQAAEPIPLRSSKGS